MLAGGLALSAVFAASFALQHGAGGTGWMAPMSVLWRVALVVSLGWGLAYPAVRLPRPRAAAERRAAAENLAEPPVKQARTAYLRAYLGLLQRYAGSLTGLVVCGASLCVVLHRVLWDIYPWQFELLVSGLAAEERELVARVLAVLGAS
jgi:hypothetical protein